MKVSEILADARSRVEAGWCKGVGEDDAGNLCAIGAICYAENYAMALDPFAKQKIEATTTWWSGEPMYATVALMRAVGEFGDYDTIPAFNDDPSTTKADVLAAFDKAIIGLEEKGL